MCIFKTCEIVVIIEYIHFRNKQISLLLKNLIANVGLNESTEKTCICTDILYVCCMLVFKAMAGIGQDPFIGSKLGTLLTEANFDVIDSQEKFLSYGKRNSNHQKDFLKHINSFYL